MIYFIINFQRTLNFFHYAIIIKKKNESEKNNLHKFEENLTFRKKIWQSDETKIEKFKF